jgi:hypothetical protein
MKTLKLALLVTTAAGAVAAGGVTYATVGNSSPSPSAQAAKDSAVAKDAPRPASVPSVPSAPTCLPKLPKLPKGKHVLNTDAKRRVPANLPQVPGSLPTAGHLPKVPVKLPVCKAGVESKGAPNGLPTGVPTLPGKANLPVPGSISCDSVPPAIKVEDGRAKDIALPNGMHLAYAHAHSVIVQSRQICVNTQRFAAVGGTFLTVERLKTPPQVTLRELAEALKMQGSLVSVAGADAWRTPLNDGMLLYSSRGYAFRITGSPAYAPMLPALASQLRAQ